MQNIAQTIMVFPECKGHTMINFTNIPINEWMWLET